MGVLKKLRGMGKQAPKRMPEWQLYGSKNKALVGEEYQARNGPPGRPDLTLWNRISKEMYADLSDQEKGEIAAEATANYELNMARWNTGLDGLKDGDSARFEE